MEAAFFDVDKTVIAKASMMAFAADFRRAGLLSRRALAKGLWIHVAYARVGASAKRLDRVRGSVLAVTRGWPRDHVRRIVAEQLTTAIEPIVFAGARELIEGHRAAGRRVFLVSAAPAEIVEPLAEHFGADGAVASVARVDLAGRYTGSLETYAFGPAKAELIRTLATDHGIDLGRSYAYGDSATDIPMLEAVGHPAAVNPDRELRRVASERGWPVLRFETTLGRPAPLDPDNPDNPATQSDTAAPAGVAGPAGALNRAPGDAGWGRAERSHTEWVRWGSAVAAVAAASGGATALARRHRAQGPTALRRAG